MARQSNIELLRVVSMALVVMVHLDGGALGLPDPEGMGALTESDAWRNAVEALTIVGVNCFTLISGYFGIHARIKGFVRFIAQCMLYSVGIYSALALTHLVPWSFAEWGRSWLVLSHTDLWYVPAYAGLYILSPFINSACGSLNRQTFTGALAAFVAFTLWCGWANGGAFNPTGYTVMQLVMMYLIGRYIGTYYPKPTGRAIFAGAAAYLALSAATFIVAAYMPSAKAFAYNAPAVVGASVALFILFAGIRFDSRLVNFLGAGAFAVYLIHKNPYIWGGAIKPLAIWMWSHTGLWGYTAFCVAFTAAIYAVCSLIDALRRNFF